MTKFARTLLALSLCLLPLAALAQGNNGYRTLNSAPPAVEGPVEVVEFFWYGCGACYQFLPLVDDWKRDAGEEVTFKRVPAVLDRRWRVHGQAYYTAEALGVTDEMHTKIFDAIHQRRQALDSQASIRALFVANGVDADAFDGAWGSFSVDRKLNDAERLARQYQVRATPSMVIGGHYVSDPGTAGGGRALIELTDMLVMQLSD